MFGGSFPGNEELLGQISKRKRQIIWPQKTLGFRESLKEITLDTFQLVAKVYFNCDSNTLLPSPPKNNTDKFLSGQYRAWKAKAEVEERPGSHKMSKGNFPGQD